jgi:hypothetical protein
VLLHRIRADGSTMEAFEDTPETAYWVFDQEGAAGREVICLRDRSINDPANENIAQPGWVIFPLEPGGGGDVPSIRIGMATDAQAENIFPGNTVASYTIVWSDSEKLITDTSVFDVTDSPGAGLYESILCKVAGTYRVWYHLRFNQDSTHTASEIQRGSVDVIHVTGSNVIVPGSSSSVETLHIDAVDMGTGLGALNAHAHGESLITVAANELLQVQFSFASGVRGLKATGESFGAQLVKRA